ncbi:coproporphyrinogen-III oxidase family protein [Burkholderia thailandensis]|uniref:coproporphyrinogen-III oxidase family protein n=1 Tax=Burkholderia thailandensis TaxID=57975 RepID=UPI0003EC977F|nr:radical SAM protein [Burkholderia thailandensis]AHI66435.1 radical SAM superfamily protein [Burkholderia thailandensis H0587]AOJ52953.1 coproporphyrinogen III oxidase [Burkholderia thailandensis]AVR28932.1 radical SAM protein [Burkholderia thailandensis]
MNVRACDFPETIEYEPNLGALLDRHPELQIERDDYNINVTANYGERLEPDALFERYKQHPGQGKPAHLYYHFPLCEYICHFCNYVKQLASPTSRDAQLDRWTDALIKESTLYAQQVPWITGALIESFYIGGGTAAVLTPAHLKRILDHVRSTFHVTPECELNIEGNPDNFCDIGKVRALSDIGFNRFSVGVQSFTPEVNQFTNRGHTPDMSRQAILNLRSTGLPFNVDMMFGLPHQTPETVSEDLRTLVELRVPTITIYRLRNADRQSMGIGNRAVWNVPKVRNRLVEQGLFPTLGATYEMRERAVEHLVRNGYQPSPCGWWSLPGTYRDGNIPRVSRNKWQRFDTMLAFGPGAYGWLAGANQSVIQTHNGSDISGYLHHMESSDTPPLAFGRLLTGNQAVGTALGFAYKSRQPIEIDRFKREYGVDLAEDEPFKTVFSELLTKGLIRSTDNGNAFLPTLNGEALHEEIISVYLHERIGSFTAAVCNKVA